MRDTRFLIGVFTKDRCVAHEPTNESRKLGETATAGALIRFIPRLVQHSRIKFAVRVLKGRYSAR